MVFYFGAGFFAAASSSGFAAWPLTASIRQQPVMIAMSFCILVPWLIPVFFDSFRRGFLRVSSKR
jgi:hypothetical protein